MDRGSNKYGRTIGLQQCSAEYVAKGGWPVKDEGQKQPRNIKELLTEMKDISESIVDLGYSAVIFNSNDIADEVRLLEEEMDDLLHEVRVMCLLASRTHEEAEQMASILQVASAAEKISEAAGDIVRLLDIDITKRPFLSSVLSGADEKIRAVSIFKGASIDGRTVGELEVESETGVRIIAVKRRKRWIYDVNGDTLLKSGDYLVVRGVDDGFAHLKDSAEGVREWK